MEYPKKLGLDITDGVAENIEDVAATTSCLFFAKRCHLMAKDMHAPRPQLRKGSRDGEGIPILYGSSFHAPIL